MIQMIYMIYIQIDDVSHLDIVKLMYNFFEYIKNYSKTSSSLLIFFRDEPSDPLTNSKSSKLKKI